MILCLLFSSVRLTIHISCAILLHNFLGDVIVNGHFSKPGPQLTWDDSKKRAEAAGGRLMLLSEVKAFLAKNGSLYGDDQWVACFGDDGVTREWVLASVTPTSSIPLGTAHVAELGYYPPWGDRPTTNWGGVPTWNYSFLYTTDERSD